MSDWQPGDLAFCVGDPDFDRGAGVGVWWPTVGCCYTVSAVYGWLFGDDVVLDFEEDPAPLDDCAWDANAFRKVTPGADIEGIEEPRRLPVKEKADA